ncbi:MULTISPECIES: pilus assembly PilX N-terminal domain-containing protein [unclassified Pseudoalteromonas]|uniref:pilus assembly PilX N-terminal domain-containing protein n=1 Tax=unclassified Pseudoalteromonas TaxID=194690 RepID=UPI000C07B668|nr:MULTISPECIES: pilus assembly PilX N-terminal domain-containing protein [unclassified Pseudoalteromonas]MDP2636270.1 pilus assembly PilX N-terminal domain-containing protein [Pseudoalteromonas sp. 1_MG-2023]PHN89389.1 hypothetical protein CSC79_13020 [Pseudoalteromonas sp. 3D05]
MSKKQHGFTLITVLILTSMASIVVLNSLRENLVQERLTGNFQKKINSRLLAEKGVFEEAKLLKQALNDNQALDVDGLIAAAGNATGSGLIGDDAIYNATLSKNAAGEIEIASQGRRYSGDAVSNLVARYKMIPGAPKSPFEQAIVGCEGVLVNGSGRIDSYDSADGPYKEEDAGTDARVGTIHHDSDVSLSGGSPIWGDVIVTGNVTLSGSSPVMGDIHANGSVTINGGTGTGVPEGYPADTRVAGDILSMQSIDFTGGRVLGVLRATKDLTIRNNDDGIVENREANGLDIMYGGKGSFPSDLGAHQYQDGKPYSHEVFKKVPDIQPVPSVDPNNPDPNHDYTDPRTNCDPILVVRNNENLAGSSTLTDLNVIEFSAFNLTANQGTFTKWPSWKKPMGQNITPVSRTVFEQPNQQVYVLDSLTVSGGKLTVQSGDVTLYIKNDFRYNNHPSNGFEIASGATLTIYIEGRVIIDDEITAHEPISSVGRAVFSIFSSYETPDMDPLVCHGVPSTGNKVGVELLSNASMYAAIYAPRAHIQVNSDSGNDFNGSLRGKTVSTCGNGGIHYDKRLKDISAGGGGATVPKLQFLGWSYKAPETIVEETEEETTP